MEKKEKDPELLEWLESKYTKKLKENLEWSRDCLQRMLNAPHTKDMMDIAYCRAGIEQSTGVLLSIESMDGYGL